MPETTKSPFDKEPAEGSREVVDRELKRHQPSGGDARQSGGLPSPGDSGEPGSAGIPKK